MKTTTIQSQPPPAAVRPAVVGMMLVLLLGSGGCSIKKMAIRELGDALAAGGTTFASDDDPELVKAAVPFSLKLMESLLEEVPDHRALLEAAAGGFTQYAYAFVQLEADELEVKDFAAAETMRARARRLYLRARNHGLRGLETKHRGFAAALQQDARTAVQRARKSDVPLLYWTAVSWSAAIAMAKDDPASVGEVPQAEALIDRALELDPGYDHGAIHAFLITYEMSRATGEGDAETRARHHFERAVALSDGMQAGPYVALAEAVSIQRQDVNGFKRLLAQALAVDPDARPEWRLVNLILQRRARWLLSRTDELFLLSQPQ